MTPPSKRWRNRLTYANIASTLALFLALTTGGGYAASQLAKNSVGPKQLRKNAVGSRAIRNASVAPRDLANRLRNRFVLHANVNSDGTLRTASRGVTVTRDATGSGYNVRFNRRVAGVCTPVVSSVNSSTSVGGQATIAGEAGEQVTVLTYDAAGNVAPGAFTLLVAC